MEGCLYHDFLSDRKWLTQLSAFSSSHTLLTNIYWLVVTVIMSYMLAMTVWLCLLEPGKLVTVLAVHSGTNDVYILFWCLSMRFGLYRSIEKLRDFIKSGIYHFDQNLEDDYLKEMKSSMPEEIRTKSNIFVCMFCFAGVFTTTLFPLSQLAFHEPEEDSFMNPILPHLFYQPFDTTSLLGTATGWALGCAKFFFVYTINCTVNWYYISGVVQMKLHFRLLNHSIANIHNRALTMYTRRRSLPVGICPLQLLEDQHFQKCLYMSLRSNILHHHALLRFSKLFEPFSGSFTLCVFTVAPIIYGCQLYLLTQPNPLNLTVTLILTFVAEMFTVAFICFLGQEVYSESEETVHRLYSIGWFHYNRQMRQLLHIMLAYCSRPLGVKALLFGMPATLETYGNVLSAMYKVTSLVRQSDLAS